MLAKHRLRLGDGMKVRIHGFLDVYAPTGRLGLKMSGIDPRYTLGEMALARDEIIRRLVAEGCSTETGRSRLPSVPLRVGVVSSIGTAAWHDFTQELRQSGDRISAPRVDVRVQGDGRVDMVAAAIRTSPVATDLDVIVVIRGGGSRTDLATFDAEPIARAIAAAGVPVLTGLGHEIDRAVADEVAHLALKTPTACAGALIERGRRLSRTDRGRLGRDRRGHPAAGRASAAPPRRGQSPDRRADPRCVALAGERLDRDARRLPLAVRGALADQQRRIERHAGRLGADGRRHVRSSGLQLDGFEGRVRLLDPVNALARGWSLTCRATDRSYARWPTSSRATSSRPSSTGARSRARSRRRSPIRTTIDDE